MKGGGGSPGKGKAVSEREQCRERPEGLSLTDTARCPWVVERFDHDLLPVCPERVVEVHDLQPLARQEFLVDRDQTLVGDALLWTRGVDERESEDIPRVHIPGAISRSVTDRSPPSKTSLRSPSLRSQPGCLIRQNSSPRSILSVAWNDEVSIVWTSMSQT